MWSPGAGSKHRRRERGFAVQDAYSLLPWPLMLAIMALGIVLVLIACLPTAWIDRLLRYLQSRFGESSR